MKKINYAVLISNSINQTIDIKCTDLIFCNNSGSDIFFNNTLVQNGEKFVYSTGFADYMVNFRLQIKNPSAVNITITYYYIEDYAD